jgi:pyruvate formate lyase activating enzyme
MDAPKHDAFTCLVIDITRGTLHDGPGMRTTVFLKGCPLRCLWCQNPEGIHSGQEIWWEGRKCIHCLSCQEACPTRAVYEDERGLHIDASKCTLCGACVTDCPARGMTFTGQEWAIGALVNEALKDKDYYDAFGGGVTVSGGEPLRQYTFVTQFFRRLKQQGVHTALDTCGLAPREAVQSVLPHTDHVLYDIKILDPELHKRYTGQYNELILGNLVYIANHIRKDNPTMKLWIRTPLIPDTTATPENIAAISVLLRDHLLDVVERWELCAFNSACKRKYQKMDRPWPYDGYELMTQAGIDEIKATALSTGMPHEKLVISGLIARRSIEDA